METVFPLLASAMFQTAGIGKHFGPQFYISWSYGATV